LEIKKINIGIPMENDWKKRLGMVYSTDPDYPYETGDEAQQGKTPPPGEQTLGIRLERKGRKGKTVTIIVGFRGSGDDLKTLAKELKTALGVGGSVKNGEILLQGDFQERAQEMLMKIGYQVKRAGGSQKI
jgi:translation initiation factor 1